MADWDPFAVEEVGSKASTEATAVSNSGVKSLSKADLDLIADAMFQETVEQKPWNKTSDPRPDLSWYTPSCTIKEWCHKDVTMDIGQGIAYVTLNRPEQGNMLTASVLLGLCDAVTLLHGMQEIRCVVFSGEGKMFCGGMDPKFDGNFASHKFGPRAEKAFLRLKERAVRAGALENMDSNPGPLLQAKLWETIAQLPAFSITILNGSCMGDGMGLLACADMVISLKQAYFSLAEVHDGIVPIITPYVVAKVGASFGKFMLGSGKNFPAEELLHHGLISELVDSVEDAHKKVAEICEVLTACGPRSVEAAKQLVVGVGGQPINEGIMFFTAALLAMVTVSEEARVGMICLQSKEPKPWEVKPIMPKH